MPDRHARAIAGFVACLVVDAALVIATLALWWPPSQNKQRALHRGFPWAADGCGSATFLGIALPLVIACAVLVLTRVIPSDVGALRLAARVVAILTVVGMILPLVESALSSCQS
jgi:hypothetical protein